MLRQHLPLKKCLFNNEAGQTLLELIIVMAISVIIIGALVFATVSSLRNAQFSKNQAQATKLAQEGIEIVRSGRDMNKDITGFTIGGNSVTSWRGDDSGCPGNSSSIWCNQISTNCGDSSAASPTYCYFNVTNQGVLNYLAVSRPLPVGAESITPFKRAVILSDFDLTYQNEKTVTVVVTWQDFSGTHESRLTTLLRKR